MIFVVLAGILASIAARIDWKTRTLPNRFTFLIASIGVLYCIAVGNTPSFLYWVMILIHISISLAFPKVLGMGDSKLILGLGLFFVSPENFLAWMSLFYILACFGALTFRQRRLAFGPYIVMAWIVVIMGDYAHVSFLDGW